MWRDAAGVPIPREPKSAHQRLIEERRGLRIALAVTLLAAALVAAAMVVLRPAGPANCQVQVAGPVGNGRAILASGVRTEQPELVIRAAVTAAIQDSALLNLADPAVPESLRYPHDGQARTGGFLGVLQLGPEAGDPAVLMDPAAAAAVFYRRAAEVDIDSPVSPGVLAATVQHTAYPQRYQAAEARADAFVDHHLPEVVRACRRR